MSKTIEVDIKCPKCANPFKETVFRTLWSETPGNREKLFNDQINIVYCPKCSERIFIPIPFMYVNAESSFAVWFEPTHDDDIDSDAENYRRIFSPPDNYYSLAPRIKHWEEFKLTIQKYERGELSLPPISELKGLNQMTSVKTKSRGCLTTILTLPLVIVGQAISILRK